MASLDGKQVGGCNGHVGDRDSQDFLELGLDTWKLALWTDIYFQAKTQGSPKQSLRKPCRSLEDLVTIFSESKIGNPSAKECFVYELWMHLLRDIHERKYWELILLQKCQDLWSPDSRSFGLVFCNRLGMLPQGWEMWARSKGRVRIV